MTTFHELHAISPHVLRDGVTARAVTRDRMTMAVIDLEPNATAPENQPDNDQLGYGTRDLITTRVRSCTPALPAS